MVFFVLGAILVAGCTGTQDTATPASSDSGNKGVITGIEPGAGIMALTEKAIEEYDLDYTLLSSSSAGMATELTKAIPEEKWIVVTGWTPHWKFARFDLKYLDDPKGIFGGEEYIATLARKGLKEDKPGVYAILKRFNWTAADMETVMLEVEQGATIDTAAANWITANKATVDGWIGADTTTSGEVSIGYVLWDSEIASTNVLKQTFEKAGYTVELSAVDAGPVYLAVSKGDVDCTISSWLPVTHAAYWEKYGDDIDMVGRNLEGAKIGLVVPSYVTINSIDELNGVKDKFV